MSYITHSLHSLSGDLKSSVADGGKAACLRLTLNKPLLRYFKELYSIKNHGVDFFGYTCL